MEAAVELTVNWAREGRSLGGVAQVCMQGERKRLSLQYLHLEVLW